MFATGPLAAVRHGMWGWLLFAGVAWLAIGWTVLRLQPADIVNVAGPVVLFGAVTEALRACAGARTWWMNAAMSLLFTATGVVLLTAQTSSYTTPAALVGWYLMVRGAVDVAVGMMTRETDRAWGLIMVVGVLEAGLGFFAASPLSRTADLVVTLLGALGLLRGVADLVTGLRLREVRAANAGILDLPPERADGLAGYTAGLADFDTAPPKPADTVPPRPATGTPRHRAIHAPGLATSGPAAPGLATSGPAAPGLAPSGPPASRPAASGRAASGPAVPGPSAPGPSAPGPKTLDAMWPYGPAEHALGAAGGSPAETAEPGIAAAGGMAAAGYVAAAGDNTTPPGPLVVPGTPGAAAIYAAGHDPHAVGDEFHQEVLRTTADLDAMLALAGVTGAAVGHKVDDADIPEVPDTPEGVDSPAESTGKSQPAG